MQTFLPYPSYVDSAQALDDRRLGKQRVECLQIVKALKLPSYGWKSHPAVRMWRDYEGQLFVYSGIVCSVWRRRGFKDTCLSKIMAYRTCSDAELEAPNPPWLTPDFCRAHQSNLIRKDPAYYGPQFPGVPDNLSYIWPEPLTTT